MKVSSIFSSSNEMRFVVHSSFKNGMKDGRDNKKRVCSSSPCVHGRNQSGFTLVELITIIVILGVIAVVAIPRFTDNATFQSRAAADQAKAVLRYAQKAAIAARSPVSVTLSRGDPASCAATVAAAMVSCVLPNSVTLEGSLVVTFDSLGRPVPNAAASAVVAGTTITVAAETGYVR